MLNIDSVLTKQGISKTAFVSLYKEFGSKYPYTYKELLACCGKVSETHPTPLTHFQTALLLIECELDRLNLTWDEWDKYVSLIGEQVKYDYDPISSAMFGGQNVGWTSHKHKSSNNSGHKSSSPSDCSHTSKTAIDSLHQTTWMM